MGDDEIRRIDPAVSVERVEIRDAIGREIHRIDQVAASSGYTAWAIWGALAVIAWKATDLASNGLGGPASLLYVTLIYFYFSLSLIIGLILSGEDGGGVYFRVPNLGRSGRVAVVFSIFICLLCSLLVWTFLSHQSPHFYWPLVCPLVFSLMLLMSVFESGKPYRVGGKGNLQQIISIIAMLIVPLVGWFCAYTIFLTNGYLAANPAGLKLALLAVGATLLIYRLITNMRSFERRGAFQRLEIELTLNKVGVGEARDRYQNLMLGMGVSAAVRPWVDAVTIRLDEAETLMSQGCQLLTAMGQVDSGTDMDGVVSSAFLDRFGLLVRQARVAVGKANKAADKFKTVCISMYGVNAFRESPVAQEARSISDALDRVSSALEKLSSSFEGVVSIYLIGKSKADDDKRTEADANNKAEIGA